MAFGRFEFHILKNAFQTLDRSTSYRWAAQELITRVEAQFFGKDRDSITLDGVIYPVFIGSPDPDPLKPLKEIASKGENAILIDSSGYSYGRFTVEKIQETLREFTAEGIPKKLEFKLQLVEWQGIDTIKPEKSKK